MEPIDLIVLTREGCHLCEEMVAVVRQVAHPEEIRLEVRDVDADPELRERYGEEVPVLLIAGRPAFRYRVGAAELARRLRSERAGARRGLFGRLR